MNLRRKIVDVLSSIDDPELKENIYSLGLIRDIHVDEGTRAVKMKFRPTAFRCPIGIQLAITVKKALMELKELSRVDIEVINFFMADQANIFLRALDRENKKEV